MKYRTPLARALKLRPGAVVRIEVTPDEIIVRRSGGLASELLTEAASAALRYNPETGRFQLDPESGLRRTGAQFSIKQ